MYDAIITIALNFFSSLVHSYLSSDVNPCQGNSPCQNQGTCVANSDGSYTCECSQIFIGDHCETRKSPELSEGARGSFVTRMTVLPIITSVWKCICRFDKHLHCSKVTPWNWLFAAGQNSPFFNITRRKWNSFSQSDNRCCT